MQGNAYPVDARGWTDERGAAAHIGQSISWLQKARHFGHGPTYVKVGRSVRYSFAALDAFMCARATPSTGEAA